jgi:hypothetical protein
MIDLLGPCRERWTTKGRHHKSRKQKNSYRVASSKHSPESEYIIMRTSCNGEDTHIPVFLGFILSTISLQSIISGCGKIVIIGRGKRHQTEGIFKKEGWR